MGGWKNSMTVPKRREKFSCYQNKHKKNFSVPGKKFNTLADHVQKFPGSIRKISRRLEKF